MTKRCGLPKGRTGLRAGFPGPLLCALGLAFALGGCPRAAPEDSAFAASDAPAGDAPPPSDSALADTAGSAPADTAAHGTPFRDGGPADATVSDSGGHPDVHPPPSDGAASDGAASDGAASDGAASGGAASDTVASDSGGDSATGADGGATTGGKFAVRITAGREHTCALHASGGVSCWGSNTRAQSGKPAGKPAAVIVPSPIAGLQKVADLDSLEAHVCARTTAGKVFCWGNNFFGACGAGPTLKGQDLAAATAVVQLGPVVRVRAGVDTTLAVDAAGGLYGWGKNNSYQLLDGTAGSSASAEKVGLGAGGGPGAVLSACVGNSHACAVRKSDGVVVCWGRSYHGELGVADSGPGVLVKTPTPVVGMPAAARVFCGRYHTCALDSKGRLWCWGRNLHGQVGTGDTKGPVTTARQVAGLGQPDDVVLGESHTCARVGGKVLCWGGNGAGQVGSGIGGATEAPKPVTVPLPADAVDVAAGAEHTCAALVDGSAWCWGANGSYQLGDGTDLNRPAPVRVEPP